ncbi:MAG: HAMP domain-containing histidine kinase [Bacteroidetes bacterium]|nr:HAMP domain-containing histidine kinase [Bacteroidota bacterium]
MAKLKAEESDQLKTAFLHNISHEIRTPLNGILGFSELLKEHLQNDQTILHYIDIISQSGENLMNVISDIVRISTIDCGQEMLNIELVNLNSICKQIYNQFHINTFRKTIKFSFHTEMQDDESYVFTDKTKIYQILSNLVSNAVKFTDTGYVLFGYSTNDNIIEFFVKDSGIGIPPEMHDKIFNRFIQVELGNNRKYGGTGLGLSISKGYVELLGGKVWLKSQLGKGSEFYFTIPNKKGNPDSHIGPLCHDRKIT